MIKILFVCHGMMGGTVPEHRYTASVRGFAVQIVTIGKRNYYRNTTFGKMAYHAGQTRKKRLPQ